jgi:glycosyltransferase involved in cell wall biosynthesis
MRIAVIAPVEEPVPPLKYGGTELVVYNLCEELVKKGHEVYLLASGDSQTSAHLIPLVPISLRQTYSVSEIDKWRNPIKIIQLATVLKEIHQLQPDIVYNHQGWRFVPFIEFVNCPVYTTIHGPLNTDNEVYTYEHFPQTPIISISHNQRKAMPKLNWVKTIYNGIDVNRFSVGESKDRNYFAFLGRTSPEKGLKEVCQMIKQTRHSLKIAAKIDTVDIPYFDQEIKPLIDGHQIEFVGEIGPDDKAEFLKKAKGLLLWLNWEEPFGLVVVEAMASGTPVIVNKRGSMPEIVVNGKNGFLVNSLAEMQERLDQVNHISAQDCRSHVEKNFSTKKMAQGYLELAGKESN